jgi:hypothetical protein
MLLLYLQFIADRQLELIFTYSFLDNIYIQD